MGLAFSFFSLSVLFWHQFTGTDNRKTIPKFATPEARLSCFTYIPELNKQPQYVVKKICLYLLF